MATKKDVVYYQYTAKVNLPFGVKIGDTFTKTDKGFVDSKGIITPYDCSDSNFFKKEELLKPMFEIGTPLLLITNIGKKINTENKYFNLTSNTVFYFVKQDKTYVYVKNMNGYVYTFMVNEIKKHFILTKSYFYISDAGIVKETFLNINKKADVYRNKVGNIFNDLKSAIAAGEEI